MQNFAAMKIRKPANFYFFFRKRKFINIFSKTHIFFSKTNKITIIIIIIISYKYIKDIFLSFLLCYSAATVIHDAIVLLLL